MRLTMLKSSSSTSPPMFLFWFVAGGVALIALWISGCAAQEGEEGDSCLATPSIKGTCRLMYDCKEEVKELIRMGKRPVRCGFKGLQAIVCCTRDVKGGSVVGRLALPGQKAKRHCDEYKKLCLFKVRQRKWEFKEIPQYSIGGVAAEENEFPHMAAIGYGEGKDIVWSCGGALISDNYVLTAAYCLINQRGERAAYVRLGTEFIEDILRGRSIKAAKGQTHRVLKRIRHPEYKRTQKYNDVALLKIEESSIEGGVEPHTPLSTILRPACLHHEGDFKLEDGKAVATGWGSLGFGEDFSPELQKVSLSVLDNSVCNKTFDVEIRTTTQLPRGIDGSLICAGELAGGKDTCRGDSGGPLQVQNHDSTCVTQVIGITSFGKLCGFQESPAVYMKVKHFVPWIESVVWP